MAKKKAEKAADKALERAKDAVAEAKRRAKKADAKARRRAKKLEAEVEALASSVKKTRARQKNAERASAPVLRAAPMGNGAAAGKKTSTAKRPEKDTIVPVPVSVPPRVKQVKRVAVTTTSAPKSPARTGAANGAAATSAAAEDLTTLTVVQLRARARERGVTGYGKFSKAQLVASLAD